MPHSIFDEPAVPPTTAVAGAPATPVPAPTPPLQTRRFGDSTATRQRIFDNALKAVQTIEPVTNHRHSLQLVDVGYSGPEDFTIAQQKEALLSRGTLSRKLQGTWVLADAAGQELARKRATLAKIPYLTDRGTFINGGNEYAMVQQMRLRPGVFTRVKDNGELEAHVNVSKGYGHRIFMEPSTGVFRVQIGQAKIPLVPLLKAMGVTDKQLRDRWGNEITAANLEQADSQAMRKFYQKLKRDGQDTDEQSVAKTVTQSFENMELDPEITKRTLGQPHARVDAPALLDITRKLLRVSNGEEEADDRDALAYQTLMGPEDQFAERLQKAKHVARQILWKASAMGNLDRVPSGAYDDSVTAAIMGSGLGQALEEINPLDVYDQQSRVTRMGDGGIPSLDAVPLESRAVQPSQFGFIDFLRTPESSRVGIDSRLAAATVKGDDGHIYTPVFDVKAGKTVYKSPQELADAVVAFPGEMQTSPEERTQQYMSERTGRPIRATSLDRKFAATHVSAIINGKVRMVPRDSVQFAVPHMEHTFSPLGNLIPLKSMVKGQRAVMASRMLTQALPLKNAESPWVQSGMPDKPGQSYEQEYASQAGAVRADQPARVVSVDADSMTLQNADGTKKNIQLHNNFPYNRKTFLHQTPMVQPGDTVQAGQVLAKSNFTNDKGELAMGLNARVAYVPWDGLNYEDAAVISKSYADRMTSEHMYQHEHEWDKQDHKGRNAFVSLFPAKYNKAMLSNFDDAGVIKPGTEVKPGDPLILIAREREMNQKSMLRGRTSSYMDDSQTWDHHSPGIVTDVIHTDKGTSVVVKSTMPMEVGDKLSGRYGDKSVVAKIVPDDQMPHNDQGQPFEVLCNPLGITSRTNPAQIVEAALGKIAAARGEPFRVPDFQDQDDYIEWAIEELQKAGMSDTESITDPRNERRVKDIFTGNRWFMKLHHQAESKNQGRGLGSYTAERTPAKGGVEGAKRIGMLELGALLSHGATAVIRDAHMVRGQANPQYWAQYMSGYKPPTPEVPYVYEKFVNSLKSAGINVVRDGERVNIMALTNKDVEKMTGDRELQNVETVDWQTMEPVPGGLFDKALTGGHGTASGGGNRWSYIKLHEPMPSPVMEEPIRRVLGLTKNNMLDIIAGKQEFNGHTGPGAIATALKNINVEREIEQARAEIKSGKRVARDSAIRRLGYLKSTQRLGIHPGEWVLDKVPVLPPAFRPVSVMGQKRLPMVADPNYLYKEVWSANKNLAELAPMVDEKDLGDERLAVYNSFKAVTGLGDPIQPKNQERQVKGILKHVFGNSPKTGAVQRRLLGNAVDIVGRSVIVPDPELDMDQVGVPESRAWDIYKPILMRNLVRGGMSRLEAGRAIEERSPKARETLVSEMERGVVIINRAPTLHRYGMMAARPKLVKGDVLKVSPLVVGGFGADFDGDAMQYHVPISEDAQKEAMEKMLPSKNLFSAATFDVHYTPSQEYVGGLYEASARVDQHNKPLVFQSAADALKAYRAGRIGVDRRVEIVGK